MNYELALEKLKRDSRNRIGLSCFLDKKRIEAMVDDARKRLNEAEAALFPWFFDRYFQPLVIPYGFPRCIKKNSFWREMAYAKRLQETGRLGPLPIWYGPNYPYRFLWTDPVSGRISWSSL